MCEYRWCIIIILYFAPYDISGFRTDRIIKSRCYDHIVTTMHRMEYMTDPIVYRGYGGIYVVVTFTTRFHSVGRLQARLLLQYYNIIYAPTFCTFSSVLYGRYNMACDRPKYYVTIIIYYINMYEIGYRRTAGSGYLRYSSWFYTTSCHNHIIINIKTITWSKYNPYGHIIYYIL